MMLQFHAISTFTLQLKLLMENQSLSAILFWRMIIKLDDLLLEFLLDYKHLRSLFSTIKQPIRWPFCLVHFKINPLCGLWSLPVFPVHFSALYPGTTCMDLKYCRRQSWEQFITSTDSDKVLGGHKSSSWVKPVKHFSPPSILQELTQLVQTTA